MIEEAILLKNIFKQYITTGINSYKMTGELIEGRVNDGYLLGRLLKKDLVKIDEVDYSLTDNGVNTCEKIFSDGELKEVAELNYILRNMPVRDIPTISSTSISSSSFTFPPSTSS